MNKRISTVLIAAAMLALAIPAFAQNSGPRPGGQGQPGRQGAPGGMQGGRMMMGGRMGEQMVEKALTKAGATADQKAKVKALNEKNAKARTTFMEKELKIKMPAPAKPGSAGAAAGRPQRPELTDAQRTKMREFSQKQMTASTAEMKKILGPKYDAFTKALQAEMQAMRGQMGGGRQGGGAAGGKGAGAGKKPPVK